MKALSFFTVLAVGILTLGFYLLINYILFNDVGLVPIGRIIFASNFGYLDYLMLPIGLLAGTLLLRKNEKTISFKQQFLFGFKTTLQASVFFGLFIFVCLKFIEPDYFQKLIALIKQPGAEFEPLRKEMLIRIKPIEETELFRNPYFYGIANFFVYLVIGALSSLVFALFLKKRSLMPTDLFRKTI